MDLASAVSVSFLNQWPSLEKLMLTFSTAYQFISSKKLEQSILIERVGFEALVMRHRSQPIHVLYCP